MPEKRKATTRAEAISALNEIGRIQQQEIALELEQFDEAVAFAIGTAIRERALSEKLPIVIDIRSFDRPLFYSALPGSTAANQDWARRKINVVERFLKSTYRIVLERNRDDRTFPASEGLAVEDYVLAGGGFPVRVKGAGIVGVIAVSGLPERLDHSVIVDALSDHLGIPRKKYGLRGGRTRALH